MLAFAEIAARFEAEAPVNRMWIVCCDMGTRLPACRVCGGPLSGRQRVYCSGACSREWDVNHAWGFASAQALRLAEHRCAECGKSWRLEVHHVVPLQGRYRVLKKLGEGGMGAVYLGEHVKMGRKSAIKVMAPSMANDPDAISRFNREAANASRISHANVCQIYDFGETPEGIIYLAMEFIEGQALTDLIEKEGALHPTRAGHILRQLDETRAGFLLLRQFEGFSDHLGDDGPGFHSITPLS